MNEHEQEYFGCLSSGEFAPEQYVSDYYGLNWPFEGELLADFNIWVNKLRLRKTCPAGAVSRYELESFMQAKNIISRKWMAIRLGMDLKSFDEISQRLDELGLRSQRYLPYDQMAAESLSEDIVPSLPGLKFRTFGDHNSFCERLHADLNNVLSIVIEPTFCATSDELQEYPRQYAIAFDCITLKPLSTKHSVWLDFRKPLILGPDRCSKLLYAANREQLSKFCAGTSEPHDLEFYVNFLKGQDNGQ